MEKDLLGGIIGNVGKNITFNINNSYNVGTINQGTSIQGTTVGAIIGVDAGTTTHQLSNCHYLSTAYTNIIGMAGYTCTGVTAQTEIDMKTAQFATTLNNGRETEVWEYNSNNNDGYPTLK